MKHGGLWFVVLCSVLLFVLLPSVHAAENTFGIVKGWVKVRDQGWQNATVHETLQVHEPFFVRVNVTTKVACDVFVMISGPGKTVTYDVLEGPSRYGRSVKNRNSPAGWSKTFEWKVRPTGNWTEGTAPLNVYVQCMKFTRDENNQGREEEEFANFALIAAYIEPEVWIEPIVVSAEEDTSPAGYVPGFTAVVVSTSILLVVLFVHSRKNNFY